MMSLRGGVTRDCTASVAISMHCRYRECSVHVLVSFFAFHVYCCAVLFRQLLLLYCRQPPSYSVLSTVLPGPALLRSKLCLTKSAFYCVKFVSIFVLRLFSSALLQLPSITGSIKVRHCTVPQEVSPFTGL